MIEQILIGVGFIAILAGTISDIKTREVPDYATYGLIFGALGIRALYALGTLNWAFLIEGVLGFILFFIIACSLFYLGQWGGGDAKLLMGIGAVFGFQLQPSHNAIGFILNLAIIGGCYGLISIIYLAYKHRKKVAKDYAVLSQKKEVIYGRYITSFFAVALVITGFYFKEYAVHIPMTILAVIFLSFFYLLIIMKSIEKHCFIKTIDVNMLTEGDWILKEVKVDGKYITGPKDLGISRKQIAKLIQLKKKNKIKNITIKEGLAFVPSFFIAYIVTIIWGNLVLLLI